MVTILLVDFMLQVSVACYLRSPCWYAELTLTIVDLSFYGLFIVWSPSKTCNGIKPFATRSSDDDNISGHGPLKQYLNQDVHVFHACVCEPGCFCKKWGSIYS